MLNIPSIQQPSSGSTRIPYMADINRPWEELLGFATRKTFRANAIIPHREEPGMYYLTKGNVNLYYISTEGLERLTLCFGPGSLFNEARSVSRCNPDGMYVSASETEVWRFPPDLMTDTTFISRHPAQIANLIHSMGVKMLIHYTFLAEMGTGSREEHVCRFILSLSRQNGNSAVFPCGLKQQQVAELLGVHRATLARILKRLKEAGVIAAFTEKKVEITDMAALTKIAGEFEGD